MGAFELLPPEIMTAILKNVDRTDILALMLTSKTLNSYLPLPYRLHWPRCWKSSTNRKPWLRRSGHRSFQGRRKSQDRWEAQYWEDDEATNAAFVKAHAVVEEDCAKRYELQYLLCTTCGRVKSRRAFDDAEAEKHVDLPMPGKQSEKIENRTCLKDGLRKPHNYLTRGTIVFGGRNYAMCLLCHSVYADEAMIRGRGTRPERCPYKGWIKGHPRQIALCEPCAANNELEIQRGDSDIGHLVESINEDTLVRARKNARLSHSKKTRSREHYRPYLIP